MAFWKNFSYANIVFYFKYTKLFYKKIIFF